MDRVRLGRALGYGARHAVKTLTSAVDAATSPDPRGAAARPAAAARPEQTSGPTLAHVAEQVLVAHRTVTQARNQVFTQGRKEATKAVKRGFWKPLKNFSGVLWLQVTGTFFAVIAAFLGQGVWRLRANLKPSSNPADAHKAYFYCIVFLLFAYFAVSNFVRAARRERQQAR